MADGDSEAERKRLGMPEELFVLIPLYETPVTHSNTHSSPLSLTHFQTMFIEEMVLLYNGWEECSHS